MEEELNKVKKELADLKSFVYKNDFSNLYVYDTPVKFRGVNIYPKDNTSVAGSLGRIKTKLDDDTQVYLAYYNGDETVSTVSQYSSTISHNTNSLSVQTYTDTITSTFKPHTVLFYGAYRDATGANVVTQGYAGRTAPTAGNCNHNIAGNAGYNTSNIGYAATDARAYISTWNDDGVVITTKLVQNGGTAYFEGVVILIG